MDTPRIKLGHYPGEAPPNKWSDYDWVFENKAQLLEIYGECVILVYNQQVVGTGQTGPEAAADAEQRLAPTAEAITPVIYMLAYRTRTIEHVKETGT